MISELSKKTKIENWRILRLRGMIANANNLLNHISARQVVQVCENKIEAIKFGQNYRKLKRNEDKRTTKPRTSQHREDKQHRKGANRQDNHPNENLP